MRKMMALSDKVRPNKHQIPHNVKSPQAIHKSRSPQLRRIQPAAPASAVQLSPESSSVCILTKLAIRKSSTTSKLPPQKSCKITTLCYCTCTQIHIFCFILDSLCSNESGSPTSNGSTHQQGDTDSGHNSITSSNYDARSTSSNSPPAHKRGPVGGYTQNTPTGSYTQNTPTGTA